MNTETQPTAAVTAHTPGPWAVLNSGRITTLGTPRTHLADVLGFSPSRNDVAAANARLIAAAPELLELVKSAAGGISYLANLAGANVGEWKAWDGKARAAIAKAEGGA